MSGRGYIPGDFWRCCDICGFDVRASRSFRTWDGLYVCAEDYEPRHPQDFVRGRRDRQNVPHPRPGSEIYIGPTVSTDALTTEDGSDFPLLTEGGIDITIEAL
jgi:hypothetical protein